MIRWTGFGWVVPVGTYLILLATEHLVEAVSGSSTFYQTHGWPMLVGFAVSATAVRLLNRRLDSRRAPASRRAAHSFMHVPLEFWSILLPLIGVIIHLA